MAMRCIIEERVIPFDPRAQAFRMAIPDALLENEPNPLHIRSLWIKYFQPTVEQLCRSRRRAILVSNRRLHRTIVFQTAMDKLCLDFSRRTENLKVSFEIDRGTRNTATPATVDTPCTPHHHREKKKVYQFRFVRLTPIPDTSRNVQFCVAEIPTPEPEAVVATFISFSDLVDGQQQHQLQVEEVLEDTDEEDDFNDPNSIRNPPGSTSAVSDEALLTTTSDVDVFDYDNLLNPPVAVAVPESSESSLLPEQGESTSLRSTLSEDTTEREAIVAIVM